MREEEMTHVSNNESIDFVTTKALPSIKDPLNIIYNDIRKDVIFFEKEV